LARRWRRFVITFMDGEVKEVKGNRAVVNLGVLTISTEQNYGLPDSDVRHFPLSNIKDWSEVEE
jgi:hypothetical protein